MRRCATVHLPLFASLRACGCAQLADTRSAILQCCLTHVMTLCCRLLTCRALCFVVINSCACAQRAISRPGLTSLCACGCAQLADMRSRGISRLRMCATPRLRDPRIKFPLNPKGKGLGGEGGPRSVPCFCRASERAPFSPARSARTARQPCRSPKP